MCNPQKENWTPYVIDIFQIVHIDSYYVKKKLKNRSH